MDIREIARRAKVSTATVSRAINRVPTVDPQLAKRVWRVVDELGYYPCLLYTSRSDLYLNRSSGNRCGILRRALLGNDHGGGSGKQSLQDVPTIPLWTHLAHSSPRFQ